MRQRRIKYYNGVYYIALSKKDVEDFNLKHNSVVDIDDIVKIKNKKNIFLK